MLPFDCSKRLILPKVQKIHNHNPKNLEKGMPKSFTFSFFFSFFFFSLLHPLNQKEEEEGKQKKKKAFTIFSPSFLRLSRKLDEATRKSRLLSASISADQIYQFASQQPRSSPKDDPKLIQGEMAKEPKKRKSEKKTSPDGTKEKKKKPGAQGSWALVVNALPFFLSFLLSFPVFPFTYKLPLCFFQSWPLGDPGRQRFFFFWQSEQNHGSRAFSSLVIIGVWQSWWNPLSHPSQSRMSLSVEGSPLMHISLLSLDCLLDCS